MKITMQFEGGISRYGSEAVNFLMPAPALTTEAQEALDALLAAADTAGVDLYEERSVEDVDEAAAEDYGYNDMADSMADKLRGIGFDLHDIDWWHGCEPDGSPKHIR